MHSSERKTSYVSRYVYVPSLDASPASAQPVREGYPHRGMLPGCTTALGWVSGWPVTRQQTAEKDRYDAIATGKRQGETRRIGRAHVWDSFVGRDLAVTEGHVPRAEAPHLDREQDAA